MWDKFNSFRVSPKNPTPSQEVRERSSIFASNLHLASTLLISLELSAADSNPDNCLSFIRVPCFTGTEILFVAVVSYTFRSWASKIVGVGRVSAFLTRIRSSSFVESHLVTFLTIGHQVLDFG